MKYIEYEKKILDEIKGVLEKNPESNEGGLVKEICLAKNVFVHGAGRSGLMAKAFAMRLSQEGISAFVVGETISPSVRKKDLLISISGSGSTKTVVDIAIEAKDAGAKVAAICGGKDNELAKESNLVVVLKGKTKSGGKSAQPLGSLFEQSAFIFLEAVAAGVAKKIGASEGQMKKRHASLE